MKLEPRFTVWVDVEPPCSTGATTAGERRVIPFTAGTFEGCGMRGKLLPGGTDWQRVRADGSLEITARYMLQSEAGEIIQVVSEGLRTASPEVLARLSAGEDVPPDQYYFRTSIRLTTGSERLKHLNDRLYVGVGTRQARSVQIVIHEVP